MLNFRPRSPIMKDSLWLTSQREKHDQTFGLCRVTKYREHRRGYRTGSGSTALHKNVLELSPRQRTTDNTPAIHRWGRRENLAPKALRPGSKVLGYCKLHLD